MIQTELIMSLSENFQRVVPCDVAWLRWRVPQLKLQDIANAVHVNEHVKGLAKGAARTQRVAGLG